MDEGNQNNPAAHGNINSGGVNGQHYTFNNQNNQGRMMGGPVNGGNLFLGDLHFHAHQVGHAPAKSSLISPRPSAEDWQQKLVMVQKSLKEMYLERFRKTNPLSMPFTFDIENIWVSLELKEYTKMDEGTNMNKYEDTDKETEEDTDDDIDKDTNKEMDQDRKEKDRNKEKKINNEHSRGTQEYTELLENAFAKEKMLIIEGKPGRGKTSLMRRLAYDWANEKQELSHFDLVIYAEFREVHKHEFDSITDLVQEYTKSCIESEEIKDLKSLLSNRSYCKQRKLLLLLDGYDESSLDKQCKELTTYLTGSAIRRPLLYNIVLTTRPGIIKKLDRQQGRFTFAEVLGFTTNEQKRKYISNHFSSKEKSNEKVEAVHALLVNNKNLNKLAETPLFLTFVCLVHERIADGTLVELYCNIIRWLIARHQQDNPDRDVPAHFEFQSNSVQTSEPLNIWQRQNTIQKHYLHFPQLLCLGKMALYYVQNNIFQDCDLTEFNIKPIIHEVGLIRKDISYDQSRNLILTFSFPHRTIQEFLAAFYCFCSNDPLNEWDTLLESYSDVFGHYSVRIADKGMNEFDKFLLRIAVSNNMPKNMEKCKYYFERINRMDLDITFDAFNTTAGLNKKLLDWFLSQCTNVSGIMFLNISNKKRHARNKLHAPYSHSKIDIASKTFSPTILSFSDWVNLQSLSFSHCTFEASSQLFFSSLIERVEVEFVKCTFDANSKLSCSDLMEPESFIFKDCIFKTYSQLSIINCTTLRYLKFQNCKIESSTNLGIATLTAIDTMQFNECNIDIASWQSITDAIGNNSIICLMLKFEKDFNKEFLIYLQKCNNVEEMEITILGYTVCQNDLLSFSDLIKLQTVTFGACTYETNSQLSFTDCSSLKNLIFNGCEVGSSTNLGITTLPSIDTVEFDECTFLTTSQLSITDCPSLKCLKHKNCKFKSSTIFDIATLPSIEIVNFKECTFEADFQLFFTNCPSLKNLKFIECIFKCTTKLGIATLPEIDTVCFDSCIIDLASWQSITNEIRDSSVKHLKLKFGKDFNKEFLIHLQKCNNVEKMEIVIFSYTIYKNYLLSFSGLMKLNSLRFERSKFKEDSQLFFLACQSMKNLQFMQCDINSNTNLGIIILSALDAVKFDGCAFEGNSQLSFTSCPSLENLQFSKCKIERDANLGIATLSAIDTVQFDECRIDLVTWQSITDQISNSNVRCLKLTFGKDPLGKGEDFNKEFLIHLQKCNNLEQMDITIQNYTIRQNDLLSFTDLIMLQSLTFGYGCTFSANSQLSFTNCPSLENLKFTECEMRSTFIGIAAFPVIDTLQFYKCFIDLATWLSITNQIKNITVKCLQLTFEKNFNGKFLSHLKKCYHIEKMNIKIWCGCKIHQSHLLSFIDLMKFSSATFEFESLIFHKCTFEADLQLSFTNCSSLRNIQFYKCEMKSCRNLVIAALPATEIVSFFKLTFEGNSQLSFTNCSSLKHLKFDQYEVKSCRNLVIAALPATEIVSFVKFTFEANSQLSFTNCSSLKNLKFDQCDMKSSTIDGITILPTIDTVQFWHCKIDLATWQSITDQIRNSSVKCFMLSVDFFIKEIYPKFLHDLQKCERIEEIHVQDIWYPDVGNILTSYEEEVTAAIAQTAQKLPALKSITLLDRISSPLDKSRRLKESNINWIEKAGQRRNPEFSVKYIVEQALY